jgi:ribosomal protein S27E
LEEKLRVVDCQLCNLFKDLSENIKLIYPLNRNDVLNAEFIIIECQECHKPMVVYGEHITELTKEAYGRILYRCKLLFGNTIRIGNKHKVCADHWVLHRLGEV